MGYKHKNWIKESEEAPFFTLEKGIYRGLNVSALGYVVGRVKDERFAGKVYKYIVKVGPVTKGKDIVDYTIYDVTCLDHVKITQADIDSKKCIVMLNFLDTNPLNFYLQIHGFNQEVDDKLGTDSGVEDIMHDYRNAVIIGKLKISEPMEI